MTRQSSFSRALGLDSDDGCTRRIIAEVGGSLLADVKSVVGGIHSLNARWAEGYAFNACNGEISNGEFLFPGEAPAFRVYLCPSV